MSETTAPSPETAQEKFDAAKLLKTDLDGIAALKQNISAYNVTPGGMARRLMDQEIGLTDETRTAISISMASAINQVLQDASEELMIRFNGLFNTNV
jgi:hypothetical protein